MCTLYIQDDSCDKELLHSSMFQRCGNVLVAETPYEERNNLIDAIADHVRGWIVIFHLGMMERVYVD